MSLESIATELGDPAAAEWVYAVHQPSEPTTRMVSLFHDLEGELLRDGWEPKKILPSEAPAAARRVLFALGEDERLLILTSTGGIHTVSVTALRRRRSHSV